MEKVNLPVEEAYTPTEEASQPLTSSIDDQTLTGGIMSKKKKAKKQKLTFSTATEDNEKQDSQCSGQYQQVLSQPATSLRHKERLEWLQKRRSMGLWVQCDDCSRWRFLEDVLDSHELPTKWFCRLNPDRKMSSCSVPEEKIGLSDEVDLIHNEYSAGSLVWARLYGFPWWPAMVDDCPDTEQFYWLDGFSDIPTHYNVVFFDNEVTRAWISPENLKPYTDYSGDKKRMGATTKKYKQRMQLAMKLADEAASLGLSERLEKFSFIARYKGPITSPKTDKATLKKFHKKLQKKYNVAFPLENEPVNKIVRKESETQNNVIILGTPKIQKIMPSRRIISTNTTEIDLDPVVTTAPVSVVESDSTVAEPNSMAVQLSEVKSNPVNSSEFTHCEIAESQEPEVSHEESAVNNDKCEPPSVADSEPIQIRIPTPSSDDFDF